MQFFCNIGQRRTQSIPEQIILISLKSGLLETAEVRTLRAPFLFKWYGGSFHHTKQSKEKTVIKWLVIAKDNYAINKSTNQN